MYCILTSKPNKSKIKIHYNNIVHSWQNGHFTSISACRMWGVRAEIQVFKRKLYIHIHLDYVRVKFISCKKKRYTTIQYYNKLFDLFGVGSTV